MSLIGSLDKKPYQAYTIEHGIERIHVQIPLKEARAFETAFAEATADGNDSKASLLQIVESHGGSIRKTKRGA